MRHPVEAVKVATLEEVRLATLNGAEGETALILKASAKLLEAVVCAPVSRAARVVREWVEDAREWADEVTLRVCEWLAARVLKTL